MVIYLYVFNINVFMCFMFFNAFTLACYILNCTFTSNSKFSMQIMSEQFVKLLDPCTVNITHEFDSESK